MATPQHVHAAALPKPKAEVVFPGDYNKVVGPKKAVFLKECTDSVSKKGTVDVQCIDVRPGSIIVSMGGSNKAVAAAAQNMVDEGLKLTSFAPLTGADLNECASATSNDCADDAKCTNTKGSYTCACKKGFYGDGKKCIRIPPVADGIRIPPVADGVETAPPKRTTPQIADGGNFWKCPPNMINPMACKCGLEFTVIKGCDTPRCKRCDVADGAKTAPPQILDGGNRWPCPPPNMNMIKACKCGVEHAVAEGWAKGCLTQRCKKCDDGWFLQLCVVDCLCFCRVPKFIWLTSRNLTVLPPTVYQAYFVCTHQPSRTDLTDYSH